MEEKQRRKFKMWLYSEGKLQKDWAIENGFKAINVTQYVTGRSNGRLEGSVCHAIRLAIDKITGEE